MVIEKLPIQLWSVAAEMGRWTPIPDTWKVVQQVAMENGPCVDIFYIYTSIPYTVPIKDGHFP